MVQRSMAALLKKVESDIDRVREEFLYNIAEDLIISSPIKTGTYVRNHSITTSTGSGGRQNSHGKPLDNGSAISDAIDKLDGQIKGLPAGATQIYIANRSPYANKVEWGGWEKVGPHQVYTGVRSRAMAHLEGAINKVKGSQ